jgi:protocatechuate 3,4-dioxygenase beta subunit
MVRTCPKAPLFFVVFVPFVVDVWWGTLMGFPMQPGLRWLVVAAIVALAPVSAPQSATQPETIEGFVVDAITSQPVRGAIVRANLAGGARSTAQTETAFRSGQDGRFVFQVRAGFLGLHATKTGYLATDAESLEITAGAPRKDLLLRLTPEGLISGRVVDQFNNPIAGASIRAVERGDVVRFSSSASATTDDLGQYTIGGLDPADYIVGIVGEKRPVYSFPTTYFPSTTASDVATAIKIEAGQERSGVDIQFRFDAPLPSKQQNALYSEASSAGTIGGVVRDGTGRGAAQTIVVLVTPQWPASVRETLADESGRFQFPNVPPGRFVLYAARIGCGAAMTPYPGKVVQLDPGARLIDLSVPLIGGGSISGALLDEFGDPLAGAVSLRGLDSPAPVRPVRTDPRGRFRIGCLPSGDYLLAADDDLVAGGLSAIDATGAKQSVAMLPVFYPGVLDSALAAPISVRTDAEVSGLTLVVRPASVTTVDVELEPRGRKVSNLRLMRAPVDDRWGDTAWNSTDGRRLDSVPAGRFTILVYGDEQLENRSRRLWASQEVVADGRTPLSVTLTPQPGGRVSGQIVFEGQGAPQQKVGVSLSPAILRTELVGAGQFSTDDILPGAYLIWWIASGPIPGWTLKSITMDGRDILDQPVEVTSGTDLNNIVVTLADQVTEISGTVTDRTGQPAAGAIVVVFPADAGHWRLPSLLTGVVSTDDDGRYVITGVPPGDYRVSVSPTSARQALPELFPKLLPTAVAVTVALGDRKVVNLTR